MSGDLLSIHNLMYLVESFLPHTSQRICGVGAAGCYFNISLIPGTRIRNNNNNNSTSFRRAHISLELVFMHRYHHADRMLSPISGSKLYLSIYVMSLTQNVYVGVCTKSAIG